MTTAKDTEPVLEVLDPVAAAAPKTIRPAKRLDDLTGRKVGLYWNTKPGGDVGLEQAARQLGEKFENIKFERFQYPYPASKAFLQKIISGGYDAIIAATSD